MFDGDACQDCGHRPLRETVERLCRDLGMEPDMSLWDDENEGWKKDKPPARRIWTPFNKPSRKPLMNACGEPLEPPDAPPPRHALE